MTLTLKDGRRSTRERDRPRGDCLNPYTQDGLRGKFRELAAPSLAPAGVAEVEAAIDRCDQWANAGELAGLPRRHRRA